jgi:translocation protein SEC63
VRIPETLVCAVEFITLATPPEHTAPMEELRRAVLRAYPDLKDKAAFWKRKASVLKVGWVCVSNGSSWLHKCPLCVSGGQNGRDTIRTDRIFADVPSVVLQ